MLRRATTSLGPQRWFMTSRGSPAPPLPGGLDTREEVEAHDEERRRLTHRLEQKRARAEGASEELSKALKSLIASEQALGGSSGDDWFEARVVPLKIEIPQTPRVRRVLDTLAD